MTREEKLNAATQGLGSYAQELYDNAPDDAKEFYRYLFAWSDIDEENDPDEKYFTEKGKECFRTMSDEGIAYIYRNGDNYTRKYVKDRLVERDGKRGVVV